MKGFSLKHSPVERRCLLRRATISLRESYNKINILIILNNILILIINTITSSITALGFGGMG